MNPFKINDLIEPSQTKKVKNLTLQIVPKDDELSSYRDRAIETVKKKIADAPDGQKHNTLRNMSYMLGGYVDGKYFTKDQAIDLVEDAIKNKKGVADLTAAFRTIESGVMEGLKKPHTKAELDQKFKSQLAIYHGQDEFGMIAKVLAELGVKRNLCTSILEINGFMINDVKYNTIYIRLVRKLGRTVKKDDFKTVIESEEVPQYNPLKDFIRKNFNKLPQGNIKALAKSLKSTQSLEFVYTFLRKWLIGMVASIDEGNFNVLVIVLIGPKNVGKTYFFSHLLPEELRNKFFARNKLKEGKDSEALMCERLLILSDEITSWDAHRFREFVSADRYTHRVPYGTRNETRNRLASNCATSNYTNVISDPKNNMRLVTIEITGRDFDAFDAIDKTDLFMEAVHLYNQGESWELTPKEIEMLDEATSKYHLQSVEKESISTHFRIPKEGETSEELTATEIMNRLRGMGNQGLKLNNIGKALNELGFESKFKKIPGTRTNKQIYFVINEAPELGEQLEGDGFSFDKI